MKINLEFNGLSLVIEKQQQMVGISISDKKSSAEKINVVSYMMPLHESKELVDSINTIIKNIENETE